MKSRLFLAIFAMLAVAACSSTSSTTGANLSSAAKGDVSGADGSAQDGTAAATDASAATADGSALGDAASANDGQGSDSGPISVVPVDSGGGEDSVVVVDTGVVDAAADDIDTGPDSGLDPNADSGSAADSGAGLSNGLGTLYAHTSSTLYRLDPSGFSLIGDFTFNLNGGQMTDIALDDNGTMFGVTFNDVFQCDKNTAKCQWLASLPTSFNGLTFVPKGTLSATSASLIGIGNDGSWNLITVNGNTANVSNLGYYGSYTSSGDAFSVEGIGTFATVKASVFGGTDALASIDPKTGKATLIGDTGVSDLWGFAWYQQKFYGFSADGNVYQVDIKTGKASAASFPVPAGLSWWGAGVSTRASSGT